MRARKQLRRFEGQRITVRGFIVGKGNKRGERGAYIKTLCIKDIVDIYDNHDLAPHVWITYSKDWKFVKIGDYVQFSAQVMSYVKNKYDRKRRKTSMVDFGFTKIEDVIVVTRREDVYPSTAPGTRSGA